MKRLILIVALSVQAYAGCTYSNVCDERGQCRLVQMCMPDVAPQVAPFWDVSRQQPLFKFQPQPVCRPVYVDGKFVQVCQ